MLLLRQIHIKLEWTILISLLAIFKWFHIWEVVVIHNNYVILYILGMMIYGH